MTRLRDHCLQTTGHALFRRGGTAEALLAFVLALLLHAVARQVANNGHDTCQERADSSGVPERAYCDCWSRCPCAQNTGNRFKVRFVGIWPKIFMMQMSPVLRHFNQCEHQIFSLAAIFTPGLQKKLCAVEYWSSGGWGGGEGGGAMLWDSRCFSGAWVQAVCVWTQLRQGEVPSQ